MRFHPTVEAVTVAHGKPRGPDRASDTPFFGIGHPGFLEIPHDPIIVFDKDGVILDMAGTCCRWRGRWPITRCRASPKAVAAPDARRASAAVGVDDEAGIIDPFGMFAREPLPGFAAPGGDDAFEHD